MGGRVRPTRCSSVEIVVTVEKDLGLDPSICHIGYRKGNLVTDRNLKVGGPKVGVGISSAVKEARGHE